jgi:4-amino-4-deoxy-L-arabinose transferase-like glycosyltransferase
VESTIVESTVVESTLVESTLVASAFRRKILLGLLVLACAVYLVALGNSGIWDANEAFYVETPREMLEANDLVNPTFNYLPRFNKPVLSYWIVAAFYQLFGVSVAVQRYAIALGALIIIGCAFVLASVSEPAAGSAKREAGSWKLEAGLWAAVGLAAAPRLMMFARRIFIDIWITAFMSLTLVFFALSERYPERRRPFLALMYVAIALGVLTKGPVAIALPALAFGLYLAAHRELRRVTRMMIPLGILIVAVIVVPWYAVLYHEQGWTYIKSFLVSENIERFTSGVGVRQQRGPLFYLPVVLSDSFPWSMLLPFAAIAAWKQRTRVEALLWCWIVAIVGFFSLSKGKQDLYIFPIVAAVAALGGLAIQRGLGERWRRWLAVTMAVTGALLAGVGAAVLYLFQTAGRIYALESALIVGAVGLAGGAIALGLVALRRPAGAVIALLAAIITVNWVFVLRVLPEFERYKSSPAFSRTIKDRLQPGDVVAHYRVDQPSMVFYLRRHVDQYFDEPAFLGAIRSGRRVFAVLSANDYAALAPQIGTTTCVLERRPTFDVKLKNVLARQPLPELLLITNQCK